MSDLIALAERCEKATGADRLLDNAIWRATAELLPMHQWIELEGEWVQSGPRHADIEVCETPHTASLDAAMQLVPEGWAWQAGLGIETEAGNADSAYAWAAPVDHGELVFAATPALALTAAALRARAAQEQGK